MKRTLKELTIKDNFMFGAVMSKPENCQRFLELILHITIENVEVNLEHSIVYHPEYKGIRLDVYAKDENKTHYNVEMQAIRENAIGKRARYYHSQIDMELLLSGEEYEKLPNTYVIFICDFDPFLKEKYCYTFDNRCLEDKDLSMQDGVKSIFLSTRGKNRNEVSKELVNFLDYVKADLEESTKDFQDDFVRQLQSSVQSIKLSRKMEEKFMILHEMLRDERAEGKAEGKAEAILDLLQDLGKISDDLKEKIISEQDTVLLLKWLKLAAKSETIQQFEKSM